LVDSAMSAKPISCAADASLRAVTDIMTSHQVRRVPIVSEDQHLLGIVSLADVAHFAQEPSLESREAQSYVPSLLAGVSRREAPETPL
jgi:predicted transcriptional regulator